MLSEVELVAKCIEKLRARFTPMAGIVSGSAAYTPNEALDFDCCVIVYDDVNDRAVLRIDEIPVDLFVRGFNQTER